MRDGDLLLWVRGDVMWRVVRWYKVITHGVGQACRGMGWDGM